LYRKRLQKREEELQAVMMALVFLYHRDQEDGNRSFYVMLTEIWQAIALVEEEEMKRSRLKTLKCVGFALELLFLAYVAQRSFSSLRTHLWNASPRIVKA
jgi:hypothetical protein